MFIQLDNSYKSISPIQPPLALPDFVILSGINGSGKTHLLQGINQGQITLNDGEEKIYPHKLVDHNTIRPNDSRDATGSSYVIRAKMLFESFSSYIDRDWDNPQVGFDDLRKNDPQKNFLPVLLPTIARYAGKKISELTESDFYKYFPLEPMLQINDMFQQDFSTLFRRYYDRKEEHQYHQYVTERMGTQQYPYVTEEEFLKVYGEPPWILVNRIIEEANLPYELNFPSKLHRDIGFVLRLTSKISGAEIQFSDLSSGEQVIMSLTLALYNTKFDLEFPKLLLMDEPDAHLHPSMTKQFLDVIKNVFVAEKAMKVIMTTHSPSTVALASEDSLFIMNKTEPRIVKATKDETLQILTTGVPTLSINYENRRQVFVESKYDALFYEKVYEKLRNKLVPEISINFISSGVGGSGSCEQVKEIVNALTSYGNRSIYGIIDWDLRNIGNEYVKVLGKDKRHSIENYIFDPILLAAFLHRERYIDRAQIGLNREDRYTDFSGFDNIRLQAIANFIVDQVMMKAGIHADSNLQEIEYVGGRKVNLPTRFFTIQGHELEDIVKEIFPQLKRYRREGELKSEIINKVIDDIPDFIPKEILSVLSEIQNFKVDSVS
jgi:ABC-type cobalamin/Fe3+-siderophores transport system ATPase subunit